MEDIIKKILKENFSGWVNVKSDMEIDQRINRMMVGLGFGDENLDKKLRFLTQPGHPRYNKPSGSFSEKIQRRISAILVLQYLRELRNEGLFDPSMSGFLFEPFMAGLLGGTMPRDYSKFDIVTKNKSYQCKLYGQDSSVSIKDLHNLPEGDYPTTLLVGYKLSNSSVEVYSIETHYLRQLTYRGNPRQSVNRAALSGLSNKGSNFSFTINLSQLDNQIIELLGGVYNDVEDIWEAVSKLHYNLETMFTGITEEGEVSDSIETSANNAQIQAKNIDDLVSQFIKGVSE